MANFIIKESGKVVFKNMKGIEEYVSEFGSIYIAGCGENRIDDFYSPDAFVSSMWGNRKNIFHV